jgi:hypothetical protein
LKQGKRLAVFINREEVQSLAGLLTGNRPKPVHKPSTTIMEHDRREGELSHPGYPQKLLEAQVGLCQTDSSSRGPTAPILRRSSGEAMRKASAEEEHHHRTAP